MKKLTADLKAKILEQVKSNFAHAEGDHAEFLETWRKAHLYHNCELPGPTFSQDDEDKNQAGEFVEPVLARAVKEALPQLLDSFTSDERLSVAFRSRGWNQHTDLNDLITFNINKIFLDEQDGYELLEKSIKEALTVGSSFAKVYVEENKHTDEATAKDWVELAEFAAMLAEGWKIDPPADFVSKKSGNYNGFEWKQTTNNTTDPQTGDKAKQTTVQIKGTIPLINVERKIKVDFVEAKDLWFDTSRGDDFAKCRYISHRILTTVGEEELKGIDPEILKNAAMNDKDVILPDLNYSGIGDHDDVISTDPKERKIYRYEDYFYSSLPNRKGETKIYQAVRFGNEIAEVNEIAFFPFVHCKCENVIGSFFGRGFYQIAKPYQDLLTKKARIADQVATKQAWPTYLAIKGQYNREQLLNSRMPGAIVEQNAAGAIDMFSNVPTLDQSFITSYELAKDSEKETLRRGFGSANLEEIPPIATATVAMGLYNDAQRGMLLSKTISRTLLTPLYSLIYDTARIEGWPLEDAEGNPVNGVVLPNRYDLTVDINTSGDDAAQIMNLQNMIQTAQALETLQGEYISPDNKYNMLKLICQRADLDADKFTTQPQPADPHAVQMQKELEALNHIASKMQLQTIELEQWKLAAEVYQLEQEAQNSIVKTHNDVAISQQESLTRIQQIKNDAASKADSNAIKNKQVNYDAILGSAKHHIEINANRANGIM
ncbi:hypothetical protein CDG24_25195 [Salmonella enterica subsp. enterica serovar Newport]|nr:hypothetical protein [Salmonella enterica subsp. enterica serovar Newport]